MESISGEKHKRAAKSLLSKKTCCLLILADFLSWKPLLNLLRADLRFVFLQSAETAELSKSQTHNEPQSSTFNILISMYL
jgi:hypothetical protein